MLFSHSVYSPVSLHWNWMEMNMRTHTLTFFYSFIIKWFQDFVSLILAPCQSKRIGQQCLGVHKAAISPLLYCLPGCLQAGQGFGDNRMLLAEQRNLSNVINGPSRPWSRHGGCRHLCFSNPSFLSLPFPFSFTSSLPSSFFPTSCHRSSFFLFFIFWEPFIFINYIPFKWRLKGTVLEAVVLAWLLEHIQDFVEQVDAH